LRRSVAHGFICHHLNTLQLHAKWREVLAAGEAFTFIPANPHHVAHIRGRCADRAAVHGRKVCHNVSSSARTA
jgi:hypothetical protein